MARRGLNLTEKETKWLKVNAKTHWWYMIYVYKVWGMSFVQDILTKDQMLITFGYCPLT